MFVTEGQVSTCYRDAQRWEGSTTHDGRAELQLYDCGKLVFRLRVRRGLPIGRVQLVVGDG
jgi:hypothetical protein